MRRRTIQRWLFYTLFGCAPGLFAASADVVLTSRTSGPLRSFTPANTLDTVTIVDATTVASNVINGCHEKRRRRE